MNPFIILFILINLFSFLLMGVDKWKACNRKYRISEFSLLSSAFFFGSIGLGIGMIIFHHKVKKRKFKILVPLYFVIQSLIIIKLVY